MKRAWAAGVALTLLVVLLGLPPLLGHFVRTTYLNLTGDLRDSLPGGRIVHQDYQRGWFSARSSTELQWRADGTSRPSSMRLDSHLGYGPHCWLTQPLRLRLGCIDGRVGIDDSRAQLPPLSVRGEIDPLGAGRVHLRDLPAPALVDDPRPRLAVRQLALDLHVRDAGQHIAGTLGVADLGWEVPDEVRAHFSGLTGTLDLRSGEEAFPTGVLHLSLAQGQVMPSPVLAGIELPGGSGATTVDLDLQPAGDQIDFGVDVHINPPASADADSPSAPSVFSMQVRHLRPAVFQELLRSLGTLSGGQASSATRGLAVLSILIDLTPRMLASRPQVQISQLQLQTLQGPVSGHLTLGVLAQVPLDSSAPLGWLYALTGDGEFVLSQAVAEGLVRHLKHPYDEEAHAVARSREQLSGWVRDGWLDQQDGQIRLHVRLNGGEIGIGSKVIDLRP